MNFNYAYLISVIASLITYLTTIRKYYYTLVTLCSVKVFIC